MSLNSMLKKAGPRFVCKALTTQHSEISWCHKALQKQLTPLLQGHVVLVPENTARKKNCCGNQTKHFVPPTIFLSSFFWSVGVPCILFPNMLPIAVFQNLLNRWVFWQMLKQCCGKSISYEVGFVILFHQSLRNEQQQSRAAVLQMALTHIHPFHTAYIFQKSLGLHLPS